jgi:hypothetical protein
MKIVKVTIRRETNPNLPRMRYPARYNAKEVERFGKGPGEFQNASGAYSGGIGRGADTEYCLILLEDAVADEYATDPDMEIINAATADADMEQWRIDNNEPETTVQDSDRVQTIYAKIGAAVGMTAQEKTAAGLDLTQEELNILDPENPLPGINKRLRSVTDIVADTGKSLTPLAI